MTSKHAPWLVVLVLGLAPACDRETAKPGPTPTAEPPGPTVAPQPTVTPPETASPQGSADPTPSAKASGSSPSPSAKTAAGASASAGPAPRKVGTASGSGATGTGFSVGISAPSPVRAGESATASVVITAKDPYKCNEKYPYKLALDAPAGGVSYPSQTVRGASVAPKQTSISVPFSVSEKGKATVSGLLSFSICTAETCLMEKQRVSVTVDVD